MPYQIYEKNMKKEYINPKSKVFDIYIDTVLLDTSIKFSSDPNDATDAPEAEEARCRFGSEFSFEADFSCE